MRRIGALIGGTVLVGLACGGPTPSDVSPPTSTSTPTTTTTTAPSTTSAAAKPSAPVPAIEGATSNGWPLYSPATVPVGASTVVAKPVVSVAVDPKGSCAVAALDDGSLVRWDFTSAAVSWPSVTNDAAVEVAPDGFGDGFWIVTRPGTAPGDEWRLWHADASASSSWTSVYESPEPLSSVVAPFVQWDGKERVFFARGPAGHERVVAVRRDGSLPYEVTSPDGSTSSLTDRSLSSRTGEDGDEPPNVTPAPRALPIGLSPDDGTLWYTDGADLYGVPYATSNWGVVGKKGALSGDVRLTPLGWALLRRDAGRVQLLDPDLKEIESFSGFVGPVASSPDGRVLVGVRDAQGPTLGTVAVTSPLGFARYVARNPTDFGRVAKDGLSATPTEFDQLYGGYDRDAYDSPWGQGPAVYATVDGFLEVLAAGFDGVFMAAEQDVARPKLAAFYDQLAVTAKAKGLDRIAGVADVGKKLLDGDESDPHVKVVLAEQQAAEPLLDSQPVDFGDFHPRGSYTRSADLSQYFRAFKWLTHLKTTADERAALTSDPALVGAWKAWVDVQSPFRAPARRPTVFGGGTLPSYVRAECVPTRVKGDEPVMYPLGWGLDSEILESTSFRRGVDPSCTVEDRYAPSGLDLLAGLGSPWAAGLEPDETRLFPHLAEVHADLAKRYGAPLDGDGFVDGWLRVVQILGDDASVPEHVDPDLWHRRLAETALASWTNLRHTMVLVNEEGGAEMGEGGGGFEWLTVEPTRGVVDPVPEAWDQVAKMLAKLADRSKGAIEDPAVAGTVHDALLDASKDAADFGDMARRQMRGEPLTDGEYSKIAMFAGAVEHPYVLFRSIGRNDMGLAAPDPTMKIVDVFDSGEIDLGGPLPQTQLQGMSRAILHVAVGRPEEIDLLLGDRRSLTLARGYVSTYDELVSDKVIDDAEWRQRVDGEPRPSWSLASARKPSP